MELLSLAQDVHVKTREGSQNTDFHKRKILGIAKALQIIQGDW